MSTEPEPFVLDRTPIELAQFLKLAGLAESGGEAKHLVQSGLVQVNDAVETRRGKKLVPGDRITFDGRTMVLRAEG